MIAIIDYGIGNIRSVYNALEYIGETPLVTSNPNIISTADGLILPGVGAFGEGMRRLKAFNLLQSLYQFVIDGKPLLGICLGFQMLMNSSTEQGTHRGLGLIKHDVIKLPVRARLPHIGWAKVKSSNTLRTPKLLVGLDGEKFYFIHSFGVLKPTIAVDAGISNYDGCELIALIEQENIFATQFHPEKSGEAGIKMLANFRDLCG